MAGTTRWRHFANAFLNRCVRCPVSRPPGWATGFRSADLLGCRPCFLSEPIRNPARSKPLTKRPLRRATSVLAGAGIVLGLIGAMVLTQLLRSLLFGVGPTDPLTFAAVPVLLVSAALTACWLPARRAARVDPMEALRYEQRPFHR